MSQRLLPLLSIGLIGGVILAACSPSATQTPAGSTIVPATPPPIGTTAPTQGGAVETTDPFAFASQFEGTYTGTWTNATFAGSTGPASVEIGIDRAAGTISLGIDLGGNVFGAADPDPEALVATITPGGDMTFTSATFGPTTVVADLSGSEPVITVSSPDVPSDRVQSFTATAAILDSDNIDFAYEVTFRDGSPAAQGTAPLVRTP
jgi:hypothetical protein